jgi:hypothetical protein
MQPLALFSAGTDPNLPGHHNEEDVHAEEKSPSSTVYDGDGDSQEDSIDDEHQGGGVSSAHVLRAQLRVCLDLEEEVISEEEGSMIREYFTLLQEAAECSKGRSMAWFLAHESEELSNTPESVQVQLVHEFFLGNAYQTNGVKKAVQAGRTANVSPDIFDLVLADRALGGHRLIVLNVDLAEHMIKMTGDRLRRLKNKSMTIEHARGAPLNSNMSDCKGNPEKAKLTPCRCSHCTQQIKCLLDDTFFSDLRDEGNLVLPCSLCCCAQCIIPQRGVGICQAPSTQKRWQSFVNDVIQGCTGVLGWCGECTMGAVGDEQPCDECDPRLQSLGRDKTFLAPADHKGLVCRKPNVDVAGIACSQWCFQSCLLRMTPEEHKRFTCNMCGEAAFWYWGRQKASTNLLYMYPFKYCRWENCDLSTPMQSQSAIVDRANRRALLNQTLDYRQYSD